MTAPKVIEFRSEHSSSIVYACGLCGLVAALNRREEAERCCVCPRCGGRRERQYTVCETCRATDDAARRAEYRARLAQLPVVEDDGGPVYVEDLSRWFDNSDAAVDALYDDSIDVEAAIVFPSKVFTASVPDLVDHVDESWAMNYEDPPDDLMSTEAAEILKEAAAKVAKFAPTVWEARSKERIQLRAPIVTTPAT